MKGIYGLFKAKTVVFAATSKISLCSQQVVEVVNEEFSVDLGGGLLWRKWPLPCLFDRQSIYFS
jgi:hypothetical protein